MTRGYNEKMGTYLRSGITTATSNPTQPTKSNACGKGKQVECFTPAEQKKIEQAVLADKRPKMFGIILYLYTELRIGELLVLKWQTLTSPQESLP